MLCPYPTCEYNDQRRTGVDYCARGACPYQMTVAAIIRDRIAQLEAGEGKALAQSERLCRLKQQYEEARRRARG